MLRLKRLPHDRVSIQVQDKKTSYDIRFWRSLIYSTIFHLLLFGMVRIEYLTTHEMLKPAIPVEVSIEQEPGDIAIADVVEEKTPMPELFSHLATPLLCIPYGVYPSHSDTTFMTEEESLNHQQPYSPITQISYHVENTPSFTSSMPREHIYPLQLHLSDDLHKLQLVSDGSLLFRYKRVSDAVAKMKLTVNPLAIDYEVTICGETGKILEWQRTRVLLDKRLQECADTLMQEIRFGKTGGDATRGIIRISFTCTGDEIDGYLVRARQ